MDTFACNVPFFQIFLQYLYKYSIYSWMCVLIDLRTVSGNNYNLADKWDTFHYSQNFGWFISSLFVIAYKHVTFCYAVANLATIAMVFVWIHHSFQRIEFPSNQIATQFTGATKRHYGMGCERNTFLNFWPILRRQIFFVMTSSRKFKSG